MEDCSYRRRSFALLVVARRMPSRRSDDRLVDQDADKTGASARSPRQQSIHQN